MNRFITDTNHISTSALYYHGSYISHHGVKGQKWGVVHERERLGSRIRRGTKAFIQKEAARGQRISRTKKGKSSFLKRNVGVPIRSGLKGVAAGLLAAAVTAGATALSGGNPLVTAAVGKTMFAVAGSYAILSSGRDAFDQICANGTYIASKAQKRKNS